MNVSLDYTMALDVQGFRNVGVSLHLSATTAQVRVQSATSTVRATVDASTTRVEVS